MTEMRITFFESMRNNAKGILLMLFAASCVAGGQLFWKLFQNQQDYLSLGAGFVLYIAGALAMTLAFRFGKLSVLHPLMTVSYGFAIALGYFVLHEVPTITQSLGVAAIVTGTFLIGGSDQ